jgi:hypothetical protein
MVSLSDILPFFRKCVSPLNIILFAIYLFVCVRYCEN